MWGCVVTSVEHSWEDWRLLRKIFQTLRRYYLPRELFLVGLRHGLGWVQNVERTLWIWIDFGEEMMSIYFVGRRYREGLRLLEEDSEFWEGEVAVYEESEV